MIVTCVTSRYLPNLIYIARLCEVDYAILLDLAPLPHQNKNSFVSRNRILDRTGTLRWLSVPIHRKNIQNIIDARIDRTNYNWIDKHIKTLAHAYPNHSEVAGDFLLQLRKILESSDGSLLDLNFRTLELILNFLNLDSILPLMQSSLQKTHSKEHRLEIAQLLEASTYVAGQVEYVVMKESGCVERMNKSKIEVVKSPELDTSIFSLNQIRYLSCLHTICTLGPVQTRKLIDQLVLSINNIKNSI